jgi:IclR family acetate operon transcriptional repressor
MTSQSTNPGTQNVAAVERAFAILQAIAAAEESVGISDLARATGLAKSTVSRLLGTLDHLNMVERAGTGGRYRLGSGLAVLAPRTTSSLIDLARPHLRALVEEVGEDAGLAVADGMDVLYVDQVQVPGAVQVQDWTGMRLPAHTVAAGFVLMRGWAGEKLDAFLAGNLERLASQTVVDPQVIRTRVGSWVDHVWTRHEFADDVNGAAAPVFGAGGSIVAAVNLYGPSYRFPGERSDDAIGALLVAAGSRISQHLATLATDS